MNALLVGREYTRSVFPASLVNTKQQMGLGCAWTVLLGQFRTQQQQSTVQLVQRGRTKKATGLAVSRVQHAHTLRSAASHSQTVFAIMVGREEKLPTR